MKVTCSGWLRNHGTRELAPESALSDARISAAVYPIGADEIVMTPVGFVRGGRPSGSVAVHRRIDTRSSPLNGQYELVTRFTRSDIVRMLAVSFNDMPVAEAFETLAKGMKLTSQQLDEDPA